MTDERDVCKPSIPCYCPRPGAGGLASGLVRHEPTDCLAALTDDEGPEMGKYSEEDKETLDKIFEQGGTPF